MKKTKSVFFFVVHGGGMKVESIADKLHNLDLLLDRYELLHSGRDPEAGIHFPDTSQTVTELPNMT